MKIKENLLFVVIFKANRFRIQQKKRDFFCMNRYISICKQIVTAPELLGYENCEKSQNRIKSVIK